MNFCLAAHQVDLDLTRKIIIWLIQQRNSGGGFISTQDTVIGLQALSTYQMWIAGVVRFFEHFGFDIVYSLDHLCATYGLS